MMKVVIDKFQRLLVLFRDTIVFMRDLVFFYRTYLLSKGTVGISKDPDIPQIENLTVKTASTITEFDNLLLQGFSFKPQTAICKRRLNKGAIGLFIFIDMHLAHMNWTAVTIKGQEILGEPPIKVDFDNNEVLAGGFWTNLKFRGMGLASYGSYKRMEYLKSIGKTISRGSIRRDNIGSLKIREKRRDERGSRFYARGRHLGILFCKSWKETPLDPEGRC